MRWYDSNTVNGQFLIQFGKIEKKNQLIRVIILKLNAMFIWIVTINELIEPESIWFSILMKNLFIWDLEWALLNKLK